MKGGVTDMFARAQIDMSGPGIISPTGKLTVIPPAGGGVLGFLRRISAYMYGRPDLAPLPTTPSKQEVNYAQNQVWETKVKSAIDNADKSRASVTMAQLLQSLPQAGQLMAYKTIAEQIKSENGVANGITDEAAAKAVSFMVNANMTPNLKIGRQVAMDYQLGINTPDLAAMMLAGAGISPGAMISPRAEAPGVPTKLGMATEEMLKKPLTQQQAMAVQGGITAAQQLGVAAYYLPGQAAARRGDVSGIMKTYESLERLQYNAPAWAIYQARVQAQMYRRQAGLSFAPIPGPETMDTSQFWTPEQQATATVTAQAQQAQAQYRINIGTQLQQQAYQFGRPALGNQMYNLFTSSAMPQGQEWFYNQLFNAQPTAIAALAGAGGLTPQLAATRFPMITGQTMGINNFALTDIRLGTNMPTGLNWGQSSLAQ
ncbi:MAG: hypothetical protein COW52_00470, partial [Nitrospirae bacterium CG17_big_fil_post_rev_8_21_14_2_50_50_9]